MSDFKSKMHQIQFRLGLRPRPRWGSLQRSPTPLAGFKGPTSKGREGRGREKSGGEGRKGGKGVGAPFNFLPPGATDLVTPLKCGTIIRCPDLSVKHAVVGKQADLSGSGHTQPRYMLMLTQCCLSVRSCVSVTKFISAPQLQ